MVPAKPLGDVKTKKLGNQLLVNIPKEVAEYLNLVPGTMKIVAATSNKLVLVKGPGPVKILDVGRGKLRLYIGLNHAPFKENERVLVAVEDDKLVIKRINYYIAKPTIKPGQYRVNLPWELVEKTGLDKHSLVKIYSDNGKIVIEPLDEDP